MLKLSELLMLIKELKEIDENDNEKCTFCGKNEAGGVWMGNESQVFCCGVCAYEIFPQLMADSIVGSASLQHLKSSKGATIEITKEQQILKRFHSAFSSALIRKLRSE